MKTKILGLLSVGLLAGPMAANAVVIFDRATFEAALDTKIVDDYENPSYVFVQPDADMSAVVGETQYTSTGFPNNNIVFQSGGNHYYCAGCNGSFLLDFTSTSVSGAGGVYGVGFDFSNGRTLPYVAYVTYGNGSTENLALSPAGFPDLEFWGITSDLLIASIHFGLTDGGTTREGDFALDNLTIGNAGSVPEPGSLTLLGLGLAGLGLSRRRKA
jgi:hypothetical protein